MFQVGFSHFLVCFFVFFCSRLIFHGTRLVLWFFMVPGQFFMVLRFGLLRVGCWGAKWDVENIPKKLPAWFVSCPHSPAYGVNDDEEDHIYITTTSSVSVCVSAHHPRTMKSNQGPWKTKKSNQGPWNSTKDHENPWNPTKDHESQPSKNHENTLKNHRTYQKPWKAMKLTYKTITLQWKPSKNLLGIGQSIKRF